MDHTSRRTENCSNRLLSGFLSQASVLPAPAVFICRGEPARDNLGETYYQVYNENSGRWEYPGQGNMSRDSKTRLSHVQESEAQLRTNPYDTKLFATWLAETDPVSVGET